MQARARREVVRLSIQVPPPPLADEYQHIRLNSRVSGRKFVLPVDANSSLLDVCDHIERHYRANYLRNAQFFKIAKLQDGYDADISLDLLVRDVFCREPGIENVIKVQLWDNDREMSILPTSMLIPEQARLSLKRNHDEGHPSRGKHRRIEAHIPEEDMEFETIVQSRETEEAERTEFLKPTLSASQLRKGGPSLRKSAQPLKKAKNIYPQTELESEVDEDSTSQPLFDDEAELPPPDADIPGEDFVPQSHREDDIKGYAIGKSPQRQRGGDIYDLSDEDEPMGKLPQSSHGPASLKRTQTPPRRRASRPSKQGEPANSASSFPTTQRGSSAKMSTIQSLESRLLSLGLEFPSPMLESDGECANQEERDRRSRRNGKRRARYIYRLERTIKEAEKVQISLENSKSNGKRQRRRCSPDVVIESPRKLSRSTKPAARVVSKEASHNAAPPMSQQESRPPPAENGYTTNQSRVSSGVPKPHRQKTPDIVQSATPPQPRMKKARSGQFNEDHQPSGDDHPLTFDDIPSAQPIRTTPPDHDVAEPMADEDPLEILSSTIKKRRVVEQHPEHEMETDDDADSDNGFSARPDPASPTAQKLRRNRATRLETATPATQKPQPQKQTKASRITESSPFSDTQPTQQLLDEEEAAAERRQAPSAETTSQDDQSKIDPSPEQNPELSFNPDTTEEMLVENPVQQDPNDADDSGSDEEEQPIVGRSISPELGDPTLHELDESSQHLPASSNPEAENKDVVMEDPSIIEPLVTETSIQPEPAADKQASVSENTSESGSDSDTGSDSSSDAASDSGPDIIPGKAKNQRSQIPLSASQPVRQPIVSRGIPRFASQAANNGANTIAELMKRKWSPPVKAQNGLANNDHYSDDAPSTSEDSSSEDEDAALAQTKATAPTILSQVSISAKGAKPTPTTPKRGPKQTITIHSDNSDDENAEITEISAHEFTPSRRSQTRSPVKKEKVGNATRKKQRASQATNGDVIVISAKEFTPSKRSQTPRSPVKKERAGTASPKKKSTGRGTNGDIREISSQEFTQRSAKKGRGGVHLSR